MARGRSFEDRTNYECPEGGIADLDATDEVRLEGRSAVLRRAVAEYLERRRQYQIREGYRQAYGADAGLGDEFEGWEEQGSWPDDWDAATDHVRLPVYFGRRPPPFPSSSAAVSSA